MEKQTLTIYVDDHTGVLHLYDPDSGETTYYDWPTDRTSWPRQVNWGIGIVKLIHKGQYVQFVVGWTQFEGHDDYYIVYVYDIQADHDTNGARFLVNLSEETLDNGFPRNPFTVTVRKESMLNLLRKGWALTMSLTSIDSLIGYLQRCQEQAYWFAVSQGIRDMIESLEAVAQDRTALTSIPIVRPEDREACIFDTDDIVDIQMLTSRIEHRLNLDLADIFTSISPQEMGHMQGCQIVIDIMHDYPDSELTPVAVFSICSQAYAAVRDLNGWYGQQGALYDYDDE